MSFVCQILLVPKLVMTSFNKYSWGLGNFSFEGAQTHSGTLVCHLPLTGRNQFQIPARDDLSEKSKRKRLNSYAVVTLIYAIVS